MPLAHECVQAMASAERHVIDPAAAAADAVSHSSCTHECCVIECGQAGHIRFVAAQITADPNVHHSELTFRVHLTRPIDRAGDLLEQPQQEHAFALPVNFTTDVEFTGAPSLQLIGRYEAEGQVARKGFREAKWVALHFTEFAGGAFGVTWLTLNTFSMFVRLQLPGTDAPFLEDLSVLPQDG